MEISDGFLALISIGILGVTWLLCDIYVRTRRNEAHDAAEQGQIELQGDINRLEFELGIINEQPKSVVIDGRTIRVPKRPDPGAPQRHG